MSDQSNRWLRFRDTGLAVLGGLTLLTVRLDGATKPLGKGDRRLVAEFPPGTRQVGPRMSHLPRACGSVDWRHPVPSSGLSSLRTVSTLIPSPAPTL